MNMIENIRFWLSREPGYGFMEFLACHSSVTAYAPARWNAFVVQMNCDGGRSFGGVNDNQGVPSKGLAKKAA